MIIVPILLLTASACQKSTLEEDPLISEKARLSFSTEGEEQIEDLNIYAFNTETGKNIAHLYTKNGKGLELPYGNYEIFVLANAGKDLGGGMTLQGLKQECFRLTSSSAIPMSGSENLKLMGDTELPITLTRCTARAEIAVTVSDAMRNMTIQSIQLKNAAVRGLFFPNGGPAANTEDLALEYTENDEKKTLSRTYNVAENCQGTVATISTQREKNIDNAPDGATYLLINALNENRFCTFRIFLGENNTTDFNLRRNSVHNLNITIYGEDEVDTRLESDPIGIEDDMEHPSFPGACIPGDYHLTFSPLRDNEDTYTAEIEFLSGDPDSFTIDGQSAPLTISLGNMNTEKIIPISYKPLLIDAENTDLEYAVTIRSGKGNVYTKNFVRKFCNTLFIYVSYPDQGYPEGGDVNPDGMFIKRITADRYRAVKVLVPGSKENLVAVCNDGFALQGWYRGLYGNIITQNEHYIHKMVNLNDTLAMKFKREKCFIYTDVEIVEVKCFKKDPILISEKSAYAVDPGASCTICGRDKSRFIAGWFDDPVLRDTSHLVSLEPEYSFTATENIKLYPKYK